MSVHVQGLESPGDDETEPPFHGFFACYTHHGDAASVSLGRTDRGLGGDDLQPRREVKKTRTGFCTLPSHLLTGGSGWLALGAGRGIGLPIRRQ